MLKKINRELNISADSLNKLNQLFVARLKYYYHRLLQSLICSFYSSGGRVKRITLVRSVRYSAPSLFPFLEGEGTVLRY